MNSQNNLHTVKMIERKKFFVKLGKGFMGLFLIGSFPYKLFGKSSSSKKVEIKINPHAVSRDKDNRKNA